MSSIFVCTYDSICTNVYELNLNSYVIIIHDITNYEKDAGITIKVYVIDILCYKIQIYVLKCIVINLRVLT